MRLKDKVAFITGSTSGIGAVVAKRFAAQGATVVLAARREDKGNAVAEEIRKAGGEAVFVRMDTAEESQVEAAVAFAVKSFGTLDVLVNNAGITRDNLILRMKEQDWDEVMDTNLKGAWNFAKAALRTMLRQEEGGSILNISSISGSVGMPGQSNYSASKAGMVGLTKALAKEVASRKVTK